MATYRTGAIKTLNRGTVRSSLQSLSCSLAALPILPRAANTCSPYRIGVGLLSTAPPASPKAPFVRRSSFHTSKGLQPRHHYPRQTTSSYRPRWCPNLSKNRHKRSSYPCYFLLLQWRTCLRGPKNRRHGKADIWCTVGLWTHRCPYKGFHQMQK
jgi:hypothetical protein